MKPKNLKLRLILLFHPQYHLVADNLCGIDCLKGCSTSTTGNTYKQYHYCHSDNGNDIYVAPLYAKLASDKEEKLVKYKTEYYELANDLYQKILAGDYVPIENKRRRELVYERKNNRSYR